MLNPFIILIDQILSLLSIVLFVWVILSLLINFNIVNRFNPIVRKVNDVLSRLLEPLLRPLRKLLDRILPVTGIDLSPVLLILLIQFVRNALYAWFYSA